MKKIKILFMIPSLAEGGAEKVLVNLVNNMNRERFDITLQVLFDGGVNKQFLHSWIKYKACFSHVFRGNTKILKLFSPRFLFKRIIQDDNDYDIIVSYLEGPTARIVSGCRDSKIKLVSWIHVEQHNIKNLSRAFRSEKEAIESYNHFDNTVCVSQYVKNDFIKILNFHKKCEVLYNTVESDQILKKSTEFVSEIEENNKIKFVAVGTLKESKGYKRLFKIVSRLINERYQIQLFVLGIGPQEQILKEYIIEHNLQDSIILLGYHTNPYKIVAKCNLFICSSFAEGFSTATTEALIVGTPVCTVEVSGMREMLGNSQYGLITENNEESLYEGIKKLLDNPEVLEYYQVKAKERGKQFSTEETVSAVESMFERILNNK